MSDSQAIYEIKKKSGQYVDLLKWPLSIKLGGEGKIISDQLPMGGMEIVNLQSEISSAMVRAAQEVIDAYLPKLETQIKTHARSLKGE